MMRTFNRSSTRFTLFCLSSPPHSSVVTLAQHQDIAPTSREIFTMSASYRQDMPPPGGFDAIKYRRNLPFRGPSGVVILGGVTAVCAYGFYRVGKGNLEKRELQREKVWSRIHLVPLLLAEGDRDAYRRQQAALEREKEIMKDVKGWEAGKSVYNNPRYRPEESIVVL